MPVPDIIRDSFFGQIIYHASGRRLLQYPEERPDFILPERYAHTRPPRSSRTASPTPEVTGPSHSASTSASIRDEEKKEKQRYSVAEGTAEGTVDEEGTIAGDGEEDGDRPQESMLADEYFHSPPIHDVEKAQFAAEEAQRIEAAHHNHNIVEWYGPDDPDCPLNVGH